MESKRKSGHNVKKGKKKKCSNEVADRFSNLPDSILHHIFSFLNMEEAVRCSLLSKSLRNLWTCLPTLDFEYKEEDNVTDEKLEGIKGFIDKWFILTDGFDLQRFSFICSKMPQSHVDSWIISALRRNVQELVLVISESLPTFLFKSNSLTLLKLGCYISDRSPTGNSMDNLEFENYLEFENHLKDSSSVCLPSLKTLILESFFLQEGVIDNFVSCCPVLESLTITDTFFNHVCIQISSLSLKHLVLETHHTYPVSYYLTRSIVWLNTPNLISFRCKVFMQHRYYLEDVSSLVKAEICMIQGFEPEEIFGLETGTPELKKERGAEHMLRLLGELRNVKDLTLSADIVDVISHPLFLKRNPTEFRNLRCLKVDASFSRDCICALKCLLEISPTIETLFIRHEDLEADRGHRITTYEDDLSLPRSLDKLEHVEIRVALGCLNGNIFKLAEILWKNTKVLKQLVICPSQ